MKKFIVILFLLVSSLYAKSCTYEFSDGLEVQWTAFKTPLKVGVKGNFDEVGLKSQKAQSIKQLLLNSEVTIQTRSANTKNSSRDATLNEFFFKPFAQSFHAKVVEVEQSRKIAKIELTVGKITKTIPLRYQFKEDVLSATGIMDVLDFDGTTALQTIHMTCYDLHEGKTWNDVKIGFVAKVSKRCQ